MEFAGHLRHLMEERGIIQAELARRSGLSTALIAMYLSGKRLSPTLSNAKTLARGLGVTMEQLAEYVSVEGEPQIILEAELLKYFRAMPEVEQLRYLNWLKKGTKKAKKIVSEAGSAPEIFDAKQPVANLTGSGRKKRIRKDKNFNDSSKSAHCR